MATTGINVGDLTLSLLVDLTDLDAAEARLAQLPGKLNPSGTAAAGLAKSFDQAAASATSAAQKIASTAPATAAAATNAQILAQRLMAEGETAQNAASALVNLGYSEKEAAAAAGLTTASIVAEDAALKSVARSAAVAGAEVQSFGSKGSGGVVGLNMQLRTAEQAIGVGLPRGVTSFLSSLPGVSSAISLAFSAGVVYFLIEALIKGTEAVSNWVAETFIYTQAAKAADEVTAALNKQIEAQTEELNKLKLAYDLVGLQGTARTSEQFRQLTVDATKNAAAIRANSDQIYGLQKGLVTLPETIDVVNGRIRELYANLSEADLAKKLLPSDADMEQVLTVLRGFQIKLLAENKDFQEKQATLGKVYDKEALAEQIAVGEARIAAAKSAADSLTGVELQQALIRNSQLKVSYLEDATAQAEANEQKYQNSLKALEQQRSLESQKLQADVSQLQVTRAQEPKQAAAIDAQIQDVERQHAAKLTEINGQITASEKEHEAAQLANAAAFLDKRRLLVQENQILLQKMLTDQIVAGTAAPAIDKEEQSIERLTIAELKLADAQTKLSLTNIAHDFDPQEAAITELANFGLITEAQKAAKLRVIYKQEEDDVLKALNELASKEKTAVDAAQANLAKKQTTIGISQEDVDQAQRYLDELLRSYDSTQKEIISQTDAYDQKRISLEQGAVAKAIALAQAEGRGKLAAALVYKQSVLDSINEDLASEKARLKDASATDEQRKALLLLIAAKQKERGQAQAAIRDLVAEANALKKTSAAMVEWKNVGIQASQDFGAAMNSAMAAIVSGQESFGKALEGVVFDVISKLAQHWADYFFALAAGYFAAQDYAHGAEATAAAVGLELLAGAFSGLASLTAQSSSGSSGTTSAGAQGPGQVSPTQTPQQPVQTVNAQRLARGGFAEKRTPVWIGDGENGGDAPEAVIPLNDDRATSRIAAALLRPMQFRAGLLSASTVSVIGNQTIGSASSQPASAASGEQRFSAMENAIERIAETAHGDIHHWNVQGLISGKDLETVALQVGKKLNRKVQKGNIRFNASNSQRVTRKG